MFAFRHLALFACAVLLATHVAACNGVGASSFAPDGSATTLVTEAGLYILDRAGQTPRFLTADINAHYPALFVNGGQDVVYVSKGLFLFKQPATAGKPVLLRQQKLSLASGFVLLLPNNQLLILDERAPNDRLMQVVDPNTNQIVDQIEGLGAIFPSAALFEARADGEGWRIVNQPPNTFHFVFQASDAPEYIYHYTADANGFAAVGELPRKLSAADRALLASHTPTDLSGAVLSATGEQLVLRTKGESAAGLYSLWLFDLTSDAPAQPLVVGVVAPPQFAFSPDSPYLAYQSASGVLQLRNLALGTTTNLPKGATLAAWR